MRFTREPAQFQLFMCPPRFTLNFSAHKHTTEHARVYTLLYYARICVSTLEKYPWNVFGGEERGNALYVRTYVLLLLLLGITVESLRRRRRLEPAHTNMYTIYRYCKYRVYGGRGHTYAYFMYYIFDTTHVYIHV